MGEALYGARRRRSSRLAGRRRAGVVDGASRGDGVLVACDEGRVAATASTSARRRDMIDVGFEDIAGFPSKKRRSALGRTIFYLLNYGNLRADLGEASNMPRIGAS